MQTKEEWTGEIIGQMHIHGITQRQLAKKMNISHEWLCSLLNGRKKSPEMEEKIREALIELINDN